MPAQSANAKSIFLDAVEISAPDQRQQYLDQACQGDAALRDHVEALLNAHGTPNAMLDGGGVVATIDQPAAQQTAQHVGSKSAPTSSCEQIGEGGMGVVYMAEQSRAGPPQSGPEDYQTGMDTKEVIARFEAERQALAMMDHPNIAKCPRWRCHGNWTALFRDGTGSGCSDHGILRSEKLTTRERLELFMQRLPSRSARTPEGDHSSRHQTIQCVGDACRWTAVPKVIDFGVAKAISQKLTEQTIYTQFAQMVGTPLYMSPEQAGMSGRDIDTRSDIYSLGVLLYELLTGTTPFDRERLHAVPPSMSFDGLFERKTRRGPVRV